MSTQENFDFTRNMLTSILDSNLPVEITARRSLQPVEKGHVSTLENPGKI